MQANRTSRRHSDHANVLAARRIVAAARRRRWFARRMRVWVGCGGRVLGRRGAVTTSGILGGRFSTFFSLSVFVSEQRRPVPEADAQVANPSRPTHRAID